MHFLTVAERDRVRPIGTERAFVTVRLGGCRSAQTLEVVPGSIGMLRADAQVVDLPERVEVLSPDRCRIKPSVGRRFVVTIETFDPFHAVAEVDDG